MSTKQQKGFKYLSMNHKNANYNNFLHIFCVVISKKIYEGSTPPLTLNWVMEGGGDFTPPPPPRVGFHLIIRNDKSCNPGILQHSVTFY